MNLAENGILKTTFYQGVSSAAQGVTNLYQDAYVTENGDMMEYFFENQKQFKILYLIQ